MKNEDETKKKEASEYKLTYEPQCPRCGFNDKTERTTTSVLIGYKEGDEETAIRFECKNCDTIFHIVVEE